MVAPTPEEVDFVLAGLDPVFAQVLAEEQEQKRLGRSIARVAKPAYEYHDWDEDDPFIGKLGSFLALIVLAVVVGYFAGMLAALIFVVAVVKCFLLVSK